jgi:P-type Cu2+ transporter
MIQERTGRVVQGFPGSARIPAIFGTIIFLYGGAPFLRGGIDDVRERQPGMMLRTRHRCLMGLGPGRGVRCLDLEFWWELALLIDVMLLGHWQEMKALGQASSALDALAALLPDTADVVVDASVQTAPTASLHVGDVVLIRPGSRVPADGIIEEGSADLDESMISGESARSHEREAIASSPAPSPRTPRCECASRPSAMVRRSPVFSG